jgi:hypothetical protein
MAAVTYPDAAYEKAAQWAALRITMLVGKFGAGEGIRTLDPNLGKVVLYH